MRRHLFLALALSGAIWSSNAAAATITDPVNDFVASYTGAHNGDLDILSASATVEGLNLRVSATVNGTVGASTGALYVFGINRGAGFSPRLGIPVAFDALAVLFPDGLARAVTFPAAGAPTITPLAGAATLDGSSISGLIPLALLPSTGASIENYSFILWSRLRVNPAADGLIGEIADYAPDMGGFRASVPEPAIWAMLIGGFGGVGASLRRRRLVRAAAG